MLKKFLSFLAILPVAALLMSAPAQAARGAPMYKPDAIIVPSGKSAEDVKNAVRRALFARNWQVKELKAGHVEATQTKAGRKGATHRAVLDIKYNTKSVTISYKDSQDLNYNSGNGTIHKTYNNWVRNVEKDVRAFLGAY